MSDALKKLALMAIDARSRSYCPYSGISVGAALLTKSGKVYLGANVENAAFGPTVCAERTAILTAVVDGERDFTAIAIAGGKKGEGSESPFPPCGVCRQVMTEFFKPDTKVLLAFGEGEYEALDFEELVPHSFSNKNM